MTQAGALRFSIITVTRNNLSGLRKTLRSLLAQEGGGFEWVVVDGASGDGTPGFLESLNGQVDFPFDWVSDPDRGIYDAMNKGLARAKGDYVLFLNAGDCLAGPETLETVRGALAGRVVDLLYGDAWEECADGTAVLKPARSHGRLARGLFTHHQAIFYRRAALDGLWYNIGYRIAADYDFTAAVLARGGAAVYVPYAFCLFERGGISQRQVRQGRVEQYRIRAARRMVPAVVNGAIYVFQAGASALKATFPGIYWRCRHFRISRAIAR